MLFAINAAALAGLALLLSGQPLALLPAALAGAYVVLFIHWRQSRAAGPAARHPGSLSSRS